MQISCILLLWLLTCFQVQGQSLRQEILLESGWKFTKGDFPQAAYSDFDDTNWQCVSVPHDWAIYGPFGRDYDLQKVAITQNLEQKASIKTGRTGGLPYVGVGWYRTRFKSPSYERTTLLFDGAMSEAQVWVNGEKACFWPYGYNSFYVDITDLLHKDQKENILCVRLENRPQSSRWYPGAGLYRNVHLIGTSSVAVPVWGTYITTQNVDSQKATVDIRFTISELGDKNLRIESKIIDPKNRVVATSIDAIREQQFEVKNPLLWSPETPWLYRVESSIYANEKLTDQYTTTFGIRSIEVVADKGFFLNGALRKFKGVCNHHDLGALGAAVNKAALRHQLSILKDMGCDAIRTAHNMPAPELIELCDQMGFMVMIEPFDEWDVAKCTNGYHRFFDQWAQRDMVNMIHQYRNNPSVVMWSIGNEVPTQCSEQGRAVVQFLQDICHREDPTRPVTCGMDQVSCVLKNGFAAALDVVGLNYRVHRYKDAYEQLPQKLILGSETASTVSSRGVYKFPVEQRSGAIYDDHQSSSYDLECCVWSNIPDYDFALADDYGWTMGQFVWTGFDYLGEPTPYDNDAWPSHSSLFGIIDLATLPKDRYYLYRSVWNKDDHTLHMLPHWTWPGREGAITPVFVYTDYPKAELFVNGKSQGIQTKSHQSVLHRYRLMWNNVRYEPGAITVVAYDEQNRPAARQTIRTAGAPYRLEVVAAQDQLLANGKDLSYITVRVVDKNGTLCPSDNRSVQFEVAGTGSFRAVANGDPTCTELFHLPTMHLFNGQAVAIVQSSTTAGQIVFTAKAQGVESGQLKIKTESK